MARIIRGLEERHEQRPQQLIRDTRPLFTRFLDYLKDPSSAIIMMFGTAGSAFFLSSISDIILFIGIIFFLICVGSKKALPFRMPEHAHMLDPNDPAPGSNKPRMSRGICYFGNEQSTGLELWFNNEDMRTHCLIFGSTGSGKTEALISLSFNALVQGSGFIYVDGKGDNSLFAKVFAMARFMGREDDLLIINFMTGARDIMGPQKSRLSNTMNPFSMGSSGMCGQLVVGLMSSSNEGSSNGDMWQNRAIAFVEALVKILVYMRDRGDILLDANSFRNYFALHKLETIAIDKRFPVDDERTVSIEDAPELVLQPLMNYLNTLPGFDRNKKGKQSAEALEQHGFITMQLTRTFTSLADTYGHILRTELPEVDFKDVVLNRRILVVLLPALEKAPEELANLGKIIVASLKAMMASGLGEEVEGTYLQTVERKITSSPTPFVCVLDEYGYYAVKGFAVVPAQARSLGFSAIFAGQDLPAFQKASKEEALSIGANTNIKIAMKLEDPTETWEFFQKTAGEAFVTQSGGFQTNTDSVSNSYADTRSAQIEKRARVDLLDLKDQREGEAHIFFKSKIVRASFFYASPKPVKYMKVNQFLKVKAPPEEELVALNNRLFYFQEIFKDPSKLRRHDMKIDPEIQFLIDFMQRETKMPGNMRAAQAFKAYYTKENAEIPQVDVVLEAPVEGMDILTQPTPSLADMERLDPMTLLSMPAYSGPLVDKHETRKDIERIERYFGEPLARASANATRLLRDLRTATKYPPGKVPPVDRDDVIKAMRVVKDYIEQLKKPAE
ncbi:MAG: TraM recognition domain-containing protein [Gammaproteobacteria bacterium]